MESKFAYLYLLSISAGIPALIDVFFGAHLLKKHVMAIIKTVSIWVIITPFIEIFALDYKAWEYNVNKTLGIFILKSPVETVIYSVFVALAVSCTTVAWTYYEDNNMPILKTSIHDIIHGTYAIWKKKTA